MLNVLNNNWNKDPYWYKVATIKDASLIYIERIYMKENYVII